MEKIFGDFCMQMFYENLVNDGMDEKKAVKETTARFKAYDEGRDAIFVK